MLSLVLPKGSLERATLELFEAADLAVHRGSDRDYRASVDDPRIDRVMFLRPQEIPRYVEQGLFDLGITGRDWITETSSAVESVCELEYSKTTSNPVRVILAVPNEHPAKSATELADGVRVSTEYPELTRRFFADAGVKAKIVPSYGATEAKVPDIVDAIVDVTETGSSLRAHGLRILDTLLVSRTELVANADSFSDTEKRAAMEDIALLLAYESGADLIVAVGAHDNLVEFLDKGRNGMASTFIVRLKVGPKLVDAKGVNRLYRSQVRTRDILLLITAAVVAMAVAASLSPALRLWGHNIVAWFHSVSRSIF